jgi:hypothetical protein
LRRRWPPHPVFFERRSRRDCSTENGTGLMARQSEGDALSTWLALIGWQVEIGQDGALVVATAHHITAKGDRLSVGACAPTKSEAVWQLFEGAMGKLGADDTGREILRSRPAVAGVAA